MKKLDTTLYLVTNSDNIKESDFLNIITQACEGGVTLVQLREKNLSSLDYYNLALKVKSITDKHNIPLIIDDRVDIALAVDAAGVHLGQTDLPLTAARSLIGKNKILGATAKTVAQAKAAQEAKADYLGVGAIYPTKTKVITVLTPVETLKDIAKTVSIPVAAIGGLDASNLEILFNSGASGICVVRAIMESKTPKETATELLRITKNHIIGDKP